MSLDVVRLTNQSSQLENLPKSVFIVVIFELNDTFLLSETINRSMVNHIDQSSTIIGFKNILKDQLRSTEVKQVVTYQAHEEWIWSYQEYLIKELLEILFDLELQGQVNRFYRLLTFDWIWSFSHF